VFSYVKYSFVRSKIWAIAYKNENPKTVLEITYEVFQIDLYAFYKRVFIIVMDYQMASAANCITTLGT
jgi:hypothetical protein